MAGGRTAQTTHSAAEELWMNIKKAFFMLRKGAVI